MTGIHTQTPRYLGIKKILKEYPTPSIQVQFKNGPRTLIDTLPKQAQGMYIYENFNTPYVIQGMYIKTVM